MALVFCYPPEHKSDFPQNGFYRVLTVPPHPEDDLPGCIDALKACTFEDDLLVPLCEEAVLAVGYAGREGLSQQAALNAVDRGWQRKRLDRLGLNPGYMLVDCAWADRAVVKARASTLNENVMIPTGYAERLRDVAPLAGVSSFLIEEFVDGEALEINGMVSEYPRVRWFPTVRQFWDAYHTQILSYEPYDGPLFVENHAAAVVEALGLSWCGVNIEFRVESCGDDYSVTVIEAHARLGEDANPAYEQSFSPDGCPFEKMCEWLQGEYEEVGE